MVIFGLLVGLGLSEIALRSIPNRWRETTYYQVFDPEVGYWGHASREATNGGDCFRVRVTTNSFGMRDRPRRIEKTSFRVAVFGDSHIEAVQVGDEQTVTRVLEKRFPSIEFLNAGVSGYGVAQEYLAYQAKIRRFRPDLVLVTMWFYNDLVDSSFDLRRAISPGG